ncbi:hypothetical protein GALL_447930 [mine drainage metagenome]|uniref:Uncharacterized protein n=1 Tax=mine drainage metagenome TaxID=410659 RepID=A0A1J5PQZ0_9ZZZZ
MLISSVSAAGHWAQPVKGEDGRGHNRIQSHQVLDVRCSLCGDGSQHRVGDSIESHQYHIDTKGDINAEWPTVAFDEDQVTNLHRTGPHIDRYVCVPTGNPRDPELVLEGLRTTVVFFYGPAGLAACREKVGILG